MKINRWAAGVATGAYVAITTLAVGASVALAATSPIDPDPYSTVPAGMGNITFYNAAGAVVTSGDGSVVGDPLYAVADRDPSTVVPIKRGVLYAYLPIQGADPGTWSGQQLGSNTIYPIPGSPAPVSAATTPTALHNILSFQSFANNFPQVSTNPAYKDIYQIRLRLAGQNNLSYASATVTIDRVTGAWAQVFPIPAAPTAAVTTTTLAVTPATPENAPANVTLTATVAPGAAAGSVEFFEGTTSLGAAVPTNASGVATKALTGVTAGTKSYTAKFTPTDAAAYQPSTSSAQTYTITAPAGTKTETEVSLAASPASPATAPVDATLTATVTPATAGSVEFFNGSTSVGTGTVASGVATLSQPGLAAGSYSYTAVFTPTNTTAFNISPASNTVALQVNAAPVAAATTTTTIEANPTTTITNAPFTITATVTPTAPGTVTFRLGNVDLPGTVAVQSDGTATKTVTQATACTCSFTAEFVPADPTQFSGSTSGSTTVTVNAREATPSPTTSTTTSSTSTTSTTTSSTSTTTAPTSSTSTTSSPSSSSTSSTSSSTSGTSSPTVTSTTSRPPTASATTAPTTAPTSSTSTSTGTATATVGGVRLGNNPTVAPGTNLVLTAAGFAPAETVKVVLGGKQIGTVKADVNGSITYLYVVASDTKDAKLAFSFDGAGVSRTFDVTVAADVTATGSSSGGGASSSTTTDDVALEATTDSGAASGDLPRTGSNVLATVFTGLLLLIVGAVGVVTARRMNPVVGKHV